MGHSKVTCTTSQFSKNNEPIAVIALNNSG